MSTVFIIAADLAALMKSPGSLHFGARHEITNT